VLARRQALVHSPLTETRASIAERIAARECTEAEVASREWANEVRGALDPLPADQRRVIELSYFGGFTHIQIAEMLELPAGTVKGRMRLGLAKLRPALDRPAEVLS
jgi:RNA polymerase sigma-70 factor (ECF subfamily)